MTKFKKGDLVRSNGKLAGAWPDRDKEKIIRTIAGRVGVVAEVTTYAGSDFLSAPLVKFDGLDPHEVGFYADQGLFYFVDEELELDPGQVVVE